MTMRACNSCGIEKALEGGFYAKPPLRGEPRYTAKCRECLRSAKRVDRTCINCRETYQSRASRQKVCDPCRSVGRVCTGCGAYKLNDRFYKKSGGSSYCKDGCAAAMNRKVLYGLSSSDYEALRARSGERCEACAATDRPLVVDHCHSTGAVRGLLCGPCNSGMGMFGDSAEAMAGAIAYLSRTGVATP